MLAGDSFGKTRELALHMSPPDSDDFDKQHLYLQRNMDQ
jgi:hypothetical protein